MMNNFRNEYDTARMDIVRFGSSDVVCTSGEQPIELADNDLDYESAFGY